MSRRIYVASSWRNIYQPQVVRDLRAADHQVYDFRDPATGGGFSWSEIDPKWQDWSPAAYCESLRHPRAEKGFANDKTGMIWADTCVLVLPCGASAHSEAGWMAGKGKAVSVLLPSEGKWEPELMYKLFDEVCADLDQVKAWLEGLE